MDGFSIHLPIVGRYRSLGVATPTKLFAVGDQKDKLTNNVRFLSEVPQRTVFEQAREFGAGALSIRALAVSRWRLRRTRPPMGFQL